MMTERHVANHVRRLLAVAVFTAFAHTAHAAEPVGKPPLPPGEHPRLLFDRRSLGTIRRRAQTPEGQGMVQRLRHYAHGHREAFVKLLARRDPKWLAEKRKGAQRLLSKISKHCWQAALLYLATGDQRDGLFAVELFRVWMSGWPPNDQIKPTQSWGNPWLAMTYDWLHELLTPDERARAQRIFGSMVGQPTMDMIGREWWFGGPTQAGRAVTNWTAICASSLGTTNLAIEGEPGYNPALLPHCIAFLRGYLTGGIGPDGAMNEGTGYACGYGTKDVPYFLIALRRRGVDLIRTTHVRHVPFWLTYELLPWGYESLPLNQSMGFMGAGDFLTFFSQEFSGLARWVFHNAIGRLPERRQINPGVGFANGWPAYKGERPDKLPPSHWFSTRGLVFCRSGWGKRDAHFCFNTNPLGAGHTHADQGAFCLSANGATFFIDPGVTLFPSDFHNLVMIDGRGQAQRQAGVDAFMRSVDLTRYADLIDADIKLAYDRRLHGESTGPWTWLEHNPVQKADRRAVFVRGVTGPVAVVADDIRKDAKVRTYTWLGHVPQNNLVTVAGRQFQVRERFGGKFLQAIGGNKLSTFVTKKARPGTVRCWLLVRSVPHITTWASNTISVNGRKAPYNTTYFGLGKFWAGWRWLPILPDRKPDIKLTGNEVRVGLHAVSGGRVALAVISYRKNWQPGDDIPKLDKDTLVLGADTVQHSDKPWDVLEAPKGVLDGVFLGRAAPTLHVVRNERARTRVLQAVHKRPGTRFLAVMAPRDEPDTRRIVVPPDGQGESAEVRATTGVDIVAGAVDGQTTAGRLKTDAQIAVVSATRADAAKKTWSGYAMMHGRRLSIDGHVLVNATGERVHVANDGQVLVVRCRGAATVTCRHLGAKRLRTNGVERPLRAKGDTITVQVPALPNEWTVAVSKDGRRVTVTGDGPQPLWVQAPKADYVTVNGVERWFLRDTKGNVCPPLDAGCPFKYDNQLEATDLQKRLVGGSDAKVDDLRSFDPKGRTGRALASKTGRIDADLPIPGPGMYRVVLHVIGTGPVRVEAAAADGAKSAQTEAQQRLDIERVELDDLRLLGTAVRVSVRAKGRVGLVAAKVAPDYRPLPANLWMTVGPFPSAYGQNGKHDTADVKSAMQRVYGPEKQPKLDAEYVGKDGQKLRWTHSDSTEGARMKEGVDFRVRCGLKNKNICFAQTVVRPPDARAAQVRIRCDYWADLYVNGVKAHTERSREAVHRDGAQFCGTKISAANIRLNKGPNTLLVKVHGGTGSNWFTIGITDPGDLKVSAKP